MARCIPRGKGFKKKKKAKKKVKGTNISRGGLVTKLDGVCRQIILRRDKWTCQKCGLMDRQGSYLDTSHVIPKKRGHHVRWVLDNMKMLCKKCHKPWWHMDPFAGEWFRNKFPDRAETIDTLNQRETQAYRDSDLLELLEELKKELALWKEIRDE